MSKCKQCGRCCRDLIVEITHSDILREPKISGHAKLLDGNGKIKYKNDRDKVYRLEMPCHFLKNNKCSIYPTRPQVCREFNAGGKMCKLTNEVKE